MVSGLTDYRKSLKVRERKWNQNGHNTFDLAEVCGGQGRASQLAVRRRLRAGENFDSVTHTDLAKPRDAAAAFAYFQNNTVYSAVMALTTSPALGRGF